MKDALLFADCKELIFLMLGKGSYNYGAQIKMSKTLLKDFPDMNFWRGYEPNTRLSSLAAFLTKQGKEEIRKNYDMFLLTKPKENIILSNSPVVDIFPVESKKNKSLMELIDEKL